MTERVPHSYIHPERDAVTISLQRYTRVTYDYPARLPLTSSHCHNVTMTKSISVNRALVEDNRDLLNTPSDEHGSTLELSLDTKRQVSRLRPSIHPSSSDPHHKRQKDKPSVSRIQFLIFLRSADLTAVGYYVDVQRSDTRSFIRAPSV
ncbi:hypothetical protein Tco_1079307 [Tanacetum coccineum]|uniref:Uncharacterized protein n=1 Tax=Tanacetum coccineum TaxID=301880 RepID=A0ABQ5HT62_9ASTR